MLAIKVDIRGMDAVQKNLARISDELKRADAIGAALNKVAEKAQAEIKRAVTERYALKAEEVRNALYLRRARAKANDFEAFIEIFGSAKKRGRSLNLIHFLAVAQFAGGAVRTRRARASKAQIKGLGRQLGFRFLKGGGIKQVKGAFIGNKGRTVFQRAEYPGGYRLPIEPVQVIGVSQMFSSRAIRTRVMAKINADLPVEVRRAVEMILARSAR